MSNISKVTIREIIEDVTTISSMYMKKEIPSVPSIMMWGPSGVGKSDSFFEIRNRLRAILGEYVGFKDLRLLLYDPTIFSGIMYPDEERKYAKSLQLDILPREDRDGKYGILLLDEISSAPSSMQGLAYQLTLNRGVGDYRLPDGWIVCAAGNRVTDRGLVNKMLAPLANRFTHYELVPDVDSWKWWAIPNGIDELILAFLTMRPEYLHKFDPKSDDVAFPSPRAWSAVDTHLKIFKSVKRAFNPIAGTIGIGIANEFEAFSRIKDQLPKLEDIIEGKDRKPPYELDVLYMLIASLVSRSAKFTNEELKNVFLYMRAMPIEYTAKAVKDLVKVPDMKNRLLLLPEAFEWLQSNKSLLRD